MRFALIVTSIGALGAAAYAGVFATRDGDGPKTAGITVVRGGAIATPNRPSSPVPAALPAQPSHLSPASRMAARATWWKPAVADTWQWQISGRIDTAYDVKVYDIDLFDAPDATIAQLHGEGRRIVCYFSAGSSENWRADFKEFKPTDVGKPLDGWAGERWLDIRSANVRRIMAERLDRAARRGCDGVEPDNVDGYANKNGLGLTADDQLAYNRFVAGEAHRRGLAVGLKNDLGQIRALVDSYDFAVNEQCNQYNECDRLRPFTSAAKPIFNAEYQTRYRDNVGGARDKLCAASRSAQIRTLVLPLALNDKYRFSCG